MLLGREKVIGWLINLLFPKQYPLTEMEEKFFLLSELGMPVAMTETMSREDRNFMIEAWLKHKGEDCEQNSR